LELDHFFILTEPSAPQAELLSEIGLIEGEPNHHPGQGTSNRRFFFSNSALELLCVHSETEAAEGPGRRLRIPERASDHDASPFGLILRGGHSSTDPFPGWRYQPDYFGPEWSFLIGENSDQLVEPLCIYMPFDPPPQLNQPRSVEPFARVTELRIHVPVTNPSPVLNTVSRNERITFHYSSAHLLELIFNDESDGEMRDLRPALPLLIRW